MDMQIKITGDIPGNIERKRTGFYSLDWALSDSRGNKGIVTTGGVGLYGRTGIGKTTIAWNLSALLYPEGKIAFADLEGFDIDYMKTVLSNGGFSGEVNLIQSSTDEEALDTLLLRMKEGYNVGILDSIGAISPISEQESDLGGANMGRRAKLVNEFSRKITGVWRRSPCMLITTNHVHPSMTLGARVTETPGGESQKFLSSVRIKLRKVEDYTEDGYTIIGKVEKNRWGINKRDFYLYYVSGWGIHPGCTAVFDCIYFKLAKVSKTIKLGEKSFGYVSKLTDHLNDPDFFAPFHNALAEYENSNTG